MNLALHVIPLLALAITACQAQRSPDLADAWPADADDAETGDEEPPPAVVTCDVPDAREIGWSGDEPPVVASLDRLVVDVYVAGGATGPAGARTAAIWLLGAEDLEVLKEVGVAGEEWISVRFDAREGDLFGLATRGEAVTLYRFAIGTGWDVEVVASRAICSPCSLPPMLPLAGPTMTVMATERIDRSEVVLHGVPDDLEAPVVSSEPLPGRRPMVARGTYGPLLFFERDDQILVAQHHWDLALADEPRAIPGGPFMPGYTATEGEDGEIVVAALEPSEPPRMALITLDGTGNRVRLREIDGPSAAARDLVVTSEESSVAVAWLDQLPGDLPGQQRVLMAAASRADLSMELGPQPLGEPFPAADRTVLAATPHRSGHTFLWAAPDSAGGNGLWGAVVECQRAR